MKGQLWLGEIQMRKPKWEQQKICARYKQNNQNARTVNLHEIHALQ